MNESINISSTDNSINSKETNISLSSEQSQSNQELHNKIIQSIVSSLQEIIKESIESNPNINYKLNKKDIFLNIIPNITLEQYLNRIFKYTKMEISSLIISIIYIDRFVAANKYVLSYYNIYRLLLTACLLSIKFNEDIQFNMKSYAEIAGIPVELLNQLEIIMFILIRFKLYVKEEDYITYFNYFSNYTKEKEKEKGKEKNTKK